MPSKASPSASLEGALERVVFANPDNAWSVVRLAVAGEKDLVTAVGKLGGVQPGEFLKLEGGWETDRKFGRQFRVDTFTTVMPTTTAAIEKYLGSGLIRGIGPKMAQRLVEHFGEETLEVIDRYSARIQEVEGIGPKRSAAIRESWVEQRDIKDVMLFLQAHDVSISHAVRIYKTYGGEAVQTVRTDPYRLATDIWGIGFKTADRIAENLGIPPSSPQRAAAGVLHLLSQAADQGHLFLPRQRLVRQATELLGVEAELIEGAIETLSGEDRLRIEPGDILDEGEPVFDSRLQAAEAGLAGRLLELAGHPPRRLEIDVDQAIDWYENRQRIELAGQQREAIRQALEQPVMVITGGPGTGKTTLVRGIVEILRKKRRRLLLGAPTGRAAKRLAEATGSEAKTIHRLLEFNPRKRRFERGAENPLETDLLIVDEASMLDTHLAHSVSRAVAPGSQLLFVGDIDQLPSVGPGNVLADLIESKAVAVVRLTEIFRQAQESQIVVNAHRINRGEMPRLSSDRDSDFFFIERDEPEEIAATVSYLVERRIPAGFGLDPRRDVQVLAPMNRGLLGVHSLNESLRELLNPRGREVARGGRVLRDGDKVMQIRNNYDLDVFNGDIGRIEKIDEVEHLVHVTFEGRSVIYDFAELDELVPAYACSIHKSQGSEYPCVVVPLHGQHYMMLERNLLYTALTRAKKVAIFVGSKRALALAVNTVRARQRFTLLADRLAMRVSPGNPPEAG